VFPVSNKENRHADILGNAIRNAKMREGLPLSDFAHVPKKMPGEISRGFGMSKKFKAAKAQSTPRPA
jgi:hypothetical protein